jgi:hypothetical protein
MSNNLSIVCLIDYTNYYQTPIFIVTLKSIQVDEAYQLTSSVNRLDTVSPVFLKKGKILCITYK